MSTARARFFAESPEPVFYFKWTEPQRTWVAEWILAHRKFYRDPQIPWCIKYYYIHRRIPMDELFGDLEREEQPQKCHVKSCCDTLHRRYKNAVKRLNGTGEMTARERKNPNIKIILGNPY
jgi:hypothetical protein